MGVSDGAPRSASEEAGSSKKSRTLSSMILTMGLVGAELVARGAVAAGPAGLAIGSVWVGFGVGKTAVDAPGGRGAIGLVERNPRPSFSGIKEREKSVLISGVFPSSFSKNRWRSARLIKFSCALRRPGSVFIVGFLGCDGLVEGQKFPSRLV